MQNGARSQNRFIRHIFIVMFLIQIAIVGFVAIKATQLRPGGDDYCWAVGAAYGPVGGPMFWWQTFAGYVVHDVSLTYVVGMPLLWLPLSFASAIPFFAAAVLVGLAIALPLTLANRTVQGRLIPLLLVPAVMGTWWASFWYPIALGETGKDSWIGLLLVHVQNVNGGYVIETTLLILLAVSAVWLYARGSRWAFGAFCLTGVWAAFCGPALAVAVALMCICGLVWTMGYHTHWRSRRSLGLVLTLVCVSLASLAAHFAPGTQARASRMGTTFAISPTRLGEWINHVFPTAVDAWVHSIIAPGSLMAFLTAVALAFILGRLGYVTATPVVVKGAIVLLAFGLMLSISSNITNFFVYSAPYHEVPMRIAVFASIWSFGFSAGLAVATRSSSLALPTLLLTSVAVQCAIIGCVLNMTVSFAARSVAWSEGPAPVRGIVADYLSWPNATTCWQDLIQISTTFPRRHQPPPPYVFNLLERRPILT